MEGNTKKKKNHEYCTVCHGSGEVVRCNYCLRSFHINCHIPSVNKQPGVKWSCKDCSPVINNEHDEILVDGQIDAQARLNKPEEFSRKTFQDNTKLILLCEAALQIESKHSNQNINYDNDLNVNSANSLTSQRLNTSKSNNNLPCKLPKASLSCLSIPMNISILKKSLTIGKNTDNNICLQHCKNCNHISDNHATITFDDDLGKYLINNHSRHGLSVDKVTYCGTYPPKDQSNYNEQIQINPQGRKIIDKRRSVREREMLRVNNRSDSDNMMVKSSYKKKKLDFKPVFKNYSNELSTNNMDVYQNVPCKCSPTPTTENGHAGPAVLHNGSILSIGCIQFKFIYYDTCENVVVNETVTTKQDDAGNKPINKKTIPKKKLKSKKTFKIKFKQPQSEQENHIDVIKSTRNKPSLVSINGHCSLKDIDDTNVVNEQNNSMLNLDNFDGGKNVNGKCESLVMHNDKKKPTLNTNLCDTSYTKQLNSTANGMLESDEPIVISDDESDEPIVTSDDDDDDAELDNDVIIISDDDE